MDSNPHPFGQLAELIRSDPEYAWAWHCNLAVPIMDVTGLCHNDANMAAALIMQQMFDCDITQHPYYTSGKSPAQEYFQARAAAEREEDAMLSHEESEHGR